MKRRLIFILAMATIAFTFQSCAKGDALLETKGEAKSDEAPIKERIEAYTEAFNNHAADKLALLWSQDGYYTNLTTQETVEGNEDIKDYFNQLFTQQNAENLKLTLSSIHYPTDDEAIVKGLAEVAFKDKHTEKSAFIFQYGKENGKWLIRSLSINMLNGVLSHFEQLKELDWLVGNWEDEDDNIDVKYTVAWDKNKNFLTQHFVLSILGQEELSGMQIIGWDPIAKKIRSWIFDSDGGYGESVWSKEGNRWYAPVTFTMPQGGKASALHVYEKSDDNTYTFASQSREVDGKLLPNIGPFKVIRNK